MQHVLSLLLLSWTQPFPLMYFFLSFVCFNMEYDVFEVEAIFKFAFSLLHDEAYIFYIVMEFKDVQCDVQTYSEMYYFMLFKYWWVYIYCGCV